MVHLSSEKIENLVMNDWRTPCLLPQQDENMGWNVYLFLYIILTSQMIEAARIFESNPKDQRYQIVHLMDLLLYREFRGIDSRTLLFL